MNHRIDAAPFKNRKTWSSGIEEIHGWKLKVYGICADGHELQPETISAAVRQISEKLILPDPQKSGYGFITLHAGEEAVWLLVDIWVQDILHHFLFAAPVSAPNHFARVPDGGPMACVWELAVIIHERNAWVKHVLSHPDNPDFESYLKDTLKIA